MNTPNALALNCVNVANYATDHGIRVNHLGSRQIRGITWQLYSVIGKGMLLPKWAIRCSHDSQLNNVAVPLEEAI